MIVSLLAATALALALIPAVLFAANCRLYRPPPGVPCPPPGEGRPRVSVLIPARNEASSIVAAMESALSSRGVDLELIVLDDQSEDQTAHLVAAVAGRDPRARLLIGPAPPPGWNGKQHACAVLARAARHPVLAFVDADVRLDPDGLARLVSFLEVTGADLISGIPRQETGTFLERLLIPLIHFVLLGFLPLARMRRSGHPAYGAGCGQLFVARRISYERSGGHAAIRGSLHDGLKLPRRFRACGLRTDLCDATAVATCRMYRGAAELWNGLAKNAHEGLAAPRTIVPVTLILLGGQVLPTALLLLAAGRFLTLSPLSCALAGLATALAYAPRLWAAARFGQSWLGAALHPLGIVILLALQWSSYCRSARGAPASWKGREYPAVVP